MKSVAESPSKLMDPTPHEVGAQGLQFCPELASLASVLPAHCEDPNLSSEWAAAFNVLGVLVVSCSFDDCFLIIGLPASYTTAQTYSFGEFGVCMCWQSFVLGSETVVSFTIGKAYGPVLAGVQL